MYSGNNLIALQSRQWLVDALLSLIMEKDYTKITIKEICKKADLSRQTFYNFFEQKDDIIRFWFRERYKIILSKYESSKKLDIKDITDVFADFLNENQEVLKFIINQELENIIADEISKLIPAFAAKVIENIEQKHTCKYVNAFFTGALTQILICWFKDEQKLSKEELSELLLDLLFRPHILF